MQILEIFCCILSSYFYAYIGAYYIPATDDYFFVVMICNELFFLLLMMLKFMVEIRTSETAVPIRNFKIIAREYLRGEFTLDFITLLPL